MLKPFTMQNGSKVLELECLLQKNQYFSKDWLPGVGDSIMFQIFDRQKPERQKYPALFHWFAIIKQFAPQAIKSWKITSSKDNYYYALRKQFYCHYPLSSQEHNQQEISTETKNCSQKSEYTMNIKFNKSDMKIIEELKNALSQKIDLTTQRLSEDEIRICFRCMPKDIQEVKNFISRYPNVLIAETRRNKVKQVNQTQ